MVDPAPDPPSGPVFVTGATGFLGEALARRLVTGGHEVRALARSEGSAEALSAMGVLPVRGDLDDRAALRAGMDGCVAAFHLAGVNAMCVRDPRPMLRANVQGSEAVVRAAADAEVARLVHTSSAATLGEAAGIIADEGTPHRGSFLSWYERSKFLAERRVLALAGELGVDVVCVNPSSVQGPGRTGGSARLLLDLANGRLPVAVDTFVSVVDIADCTDGHLLAWTRGERGRRYLLSGASLRTTEAVAMLRRVCGRPRRVWFVPRAAARAAGATAGVLARVAGRDVPLCPEMVATLLHGHRYDGSRAERELGLRYTPIEETVRRALAWYAERGLAPPLEARRNAPGVG